MMNAVAAIPGKNLFGLWRDHPLYMHFATLFAALVTIACLILGWNNYHQGRHLVLSAAADEFNRMKKDSADQIDRLHAPAEAVVKWMSVAPFANATTLEARLDRLRSMAAFLQMQPQITSLYMGYSTGDFFLVRPLRSDADRKQFKTPPNAAYLLQSIERAKNAVRFIAYDNSLNPIADIEPGEQFLNQFDPRLRPWYSKAQGSATVVRTAPYVFFGTGNIGLTIAQYSGKGVAGADITLVSVSEALERARSTPSSQLVIFGEDKRAIAYSNPKRLLLADNGEARDMPPVGVLSPALERAAVTPEAFLNGGEVDAGGRQWMVRVAPLKGDDTGGRLAVAVPLDELLIEVRAQLRRNLLIAMGIVLFTIFTTWLMSLRIVGNLRALSGQVAAIRRFNFSDVAPVRTNISEIFDLSQAMQQMKSTIGRFLDIAQTLSAERDVNRLLQRVLTESHEAAGGEGGVIYLLDDGGMTLRPAAQRWRNAETQLVPPEIAMQETDHPIVRALGTVVTVGETSAPAMHTLGVPRPEALAFLNTYFGPDEANMLTLPLKNRSGVPMGLLCLFYRGDAEQPSTDRLALAEAFLGTGALAIDNQRLLQAQKGLLDSFIALLARAIDAKSPYTYGHCQRVPELTEMLTRAACDAKEGPFANFNLTNEEWEAMHVAGWLHDCGKVTTPEYVVDKATKLETIYDRIHVVRMRFEVLKRDAEIDCLSKIAAGADAAQARAARDALCRTLDEEFAFVAHCNEGGEFMAPEKIEKLKAIAARTWQRTLDNRLGVSREEAERMGNTLAQALPITETLLFDKQEHIIPRREQERIPQNNRWGFRLRVPEHKYNRGEIYNLSISRGTLTAEERYMVNDHIVQTIMMLTELPFPAHLKNVAEIAGGHHEKMNGQGYPKRLTRDQMSVQARIMAVADIFEALTAADRPYKKGKTLSEALGIMRNMKETGHIDPEIFDLFLTSGVYRRFAEKYVAPDHLDVADINAYLTVPGAAPKPIADNI
jgi:HD-GYP domain-containing protein (c-di-GMP phosphodiesterase class II)